MDTSFSLSESEDALRDWFINPPMLNMPVTATEANGIKISLYKTYNIALHYYTQIFLHPQVGEAATTSYGTQRRAPSLLSVLTSGETKPSISPLEMMCYTP